eukprot:CAMPEP_0117550182 /NCGR_PEP_ID=MMETSP0784-20121206/48549_1 /TAXON_ID=39447 /ORGANISM="" /LENGTH=69 /DNA_ID=CAMNT_0005347193 /DNA_START=69 /DNA_END=275 /DNA_ORIENTATION=-
MSDGIDDYEFKVMSPSHMTSCLSGSNFARLRADSRGVLIEKEKKQHKVAFIDEVRDGAELCEVKEVRAW